MLVVRKVQREVVSRFQSHALSLLMPSILVLEHESGRLATAFWKASETSKLRKAVESFDRNGYKRDWDEIAKDVGGGRSKLQCANKWQGLSIVRSRKNSKPIFFVPFVLP